MEPLYGRMAVTCLQRRVLGDESALQREQVNIFAAAYIEYGQIAHRFKISI